jgi:amidase
VTTEGVFEVQLGKLLFYANTADPLSYCGLYGLRPSWGRISFRNVAQVFTGMESRRTTPGPLAHCPDDIDLFMSSYMAVQPWKLDPDVLPIPWRSQHDVMPAGPLCFAVAYGDEEVCEHPGYILFSFV